MDANEQLSVTLAAQDWDRVLGLLGEAPFRVVAPLISAIQIQCMGRGTAMVGPQNTVVSHLRPVPDTADVPDVSA